MLVCWLFWAYRPFETLFQSMTGHLSERGRKKREMIDKSKNGQTTPPAHTASAVGPCPILIQISRTHRHHWKFTQDHHTTRPPPSLLERESFTLRRDPIKVGKTYFKIRVINGLSMCIVTSVVRKTPYKKVSPCVLPLLETLRKTMLVTVCLFLFTGKLTKADVHRGNWKMSSYH